MSRRLASWVAATAMLWAGGMVGGSPAAIPHAAPPTADPRPVARCDDARRALGFYRRLRARWHTRLGRPTLHIGRERPRDCERVRELVRFARARARAEAALVRWHYDWPAWLPSNWVAVARCETSLNFEHENSSFVSAFGISWREYNADAAYMGAPPWHVRHTPRDQYRAAVGHYRRFGDGWTCPGP